MLAKRHFRGQRRPEVFPIGCGNQIDNESDAQGNDIAHTVQNADKHRGSYVRTNKPNTRSKRNQSDSANGIRRATHTDDMRIRRLTPTECCRLQGFPDNWVDGISDAQKYKCLGNAVTTNVIEVIGKRLYESTKKS